MQEVGLWGAGISGMGRGFWGAGTGMWAEVTTTFGFGFFLFWGFFRVWGPLRNGAKISKSTTETTVTHPILKGPAQIANPTFQRPGSTQRRALPVTPSQPPNIGYTRVYRTRLHRLLARSAAPYSFVPLCESQYFIFSAPHDSQRSAPPHPHTPTPPLPAPHPHTPSASPPSPAAITSSVCTLPLCNASSPQHQPHIPTPTSLCLRNVSYVGRTGILGAAAEALHGYAQEGEGGGGEGEGQGRGDIESKHSTVVESPPPSPLLRASI